MVTVSNLRRLERLEEKSAVPDTEYENFMGSVLEARMKAAVLQIALMRREAELTNEETEELRARFKKAKAFAEEVEEHRPTSRPNRSGEFVMSADMEAVLEERRRKREEAEKEYGRRENGSEVGGRSRNARVLAGYGSGN
jgi:hypothetical protein